MSLRKAMGVLASLAGTAMAPLAGAMPQDVATTVRFEPAFFRHVRGRGETGIDLALHAAGPHVAPGLHALDVVRNGRPFGRHLVRFIAPDGDGSAVPCLDRRLAEALGVALARLSREQRARFEHGACVAFESVIPSARAEYDAGELALRVSLPQAVLAGRIEDAIDPALFDAGIAAFRMRYALSATHRDARDDAPDRTQAHLQLEAGANLDRWRLRHRSAHTWRSGTPLRNDAIATTVEHDIDTLAAQATLGDFHTRGALFDTVGLRGVRVASDDRMLPPSRVRHAPVIRGIAATNARVQVRQGDTVLLDTTVAPGPFDLENVRPVGAGDALQVQVVEEDGSSTAFAVPNAAAPGLLRRGHARFGVAAGRWRPSRHARGSGVVEMTWEAGTGDHGTARAGVQLAGDYAHALGGVALSAPVGVLSLDLSHARSAGDAGTRARMGYAGFFAPTRTSIDVAAWRVGSDGFRSLHEAMQPTPRDGPAMREHTRIDLALRQEARRAGAFSFALVERRHAPRRPDRSAQLGWGRTFGRGRARLDASFEQTRQRRHGALSLSLPLRVGATAHSLHAQARAAPSQTAMQVGVQGPIGASRATYGIGRLQSDARASAGTTSASLGWLGNAVRFGAGVGMSPQARQWSANAEGALLAHHDGLTFAPAMGEAVALLRTGHGRGARVLHDPHKRLDRSGRAVVAHLSPYRRNRVGIDPQGADPAVHFAWTEREVIPRAGAVVDVPLPALHAPARWLRVVREDGSAPPFAADVVSPWGDSVGGIGRDGVAYLRIGTDATHVDVRWQEEGEPGACRITLATPPRTMAFAPEAATCVALPESPR
ncbi:fimbrial biogenesis outer membrane usher protein [Lysobacter sp. KIS68-7]|uniref:fimbria/pilus outer membrane usher protein n=1 Tax=Lysobacter sp. KIS68-7 TaxID=2904252 RepID=UPI001E3B0C91|nr:fimbria/pilus outer membrane usher protein [Lysobacter sp. KIS68-7]UHQ19466.1 fimbrial biogenesis outer membrane usher protein [Lysobacter sp. KIS68-7]